MARNTPVPVITDHDQDYVRDFLIHEDEHILAFNKPSSLPVQTRGNKGRNLDHLLWTFARSNGKRPRLVHRIDTGTSGLIIAAKTQPAAALLSEAFATRRVSKTYLALVGGVIPEDASGKIETYMVSVEGNRPRMLAVEKPMEGAKPAQTYWEVVARAESYALMKIRPRTGRMHQIRVHLASINCPILGDTLYGAGAMTGPRLMLHAAGLHLDGEIPVHLEAPMPEDMRAAAEAAKLSL